MTRLFQPSPPRCAKRGITTAPLHRFSWSDGPACGRSGTRSIIAPDASVPGLKQPGFLFRGDRLLQQLFRERDLISVSDESVIESKVEIVTLHFCCDARGRVADPSAQGRKFLMPELSKPGVCRRETNRPSQIFPTRAKTRFPVAQFGL